MAMPLRVVAVLLVTALAAAGCGGGSGPETNDLSTTCGLVRKALPPSTYDAKTNARFAAALADIDQAADSKAHAAIAAFVATVDKMVDTAARPEAFIDAHVDFLGAGEALNKACTAVGAAAVLK